MIDVSTPPVWDPPPRRPRPTLALISLAIVLVTVAAGVVIARDNLEHRYARGPAPCEKLGLSAFSRLLGGSTPQVTRSQYDDTGCDVLFPGTGLVDAAMGRLNLTYANSALGARWYDQQHDAPDGATAVDGLGDSARLALTRPGEQRFCLAEVTVVDSNLSLDLQMAFPADTGSSCSQLDAMGDAAKETARSFLTVLEAA